MPRVGNKRKKNRTAKHVDESEREKKHTPRCFVLKRGAVGDRVKDLVSDFRQVMMPNTAKNLKESKTNRIEDFVAVSGQLGVSHVIIFTASSLGTYMRFVKLPAGPTLTYKLSGFTLMRDVRASQKRPRTVSGEYGAAALQVLNGFGTGKDATTAERRLSAEMLRGLYPAIDVPSFTQADCRRVVLFHNDAEKGVVHFRHYSVARRQTGMARGVTKLLNPLRLPKLGKQGDVADYVLGVGGASDSEFEGTMEAPGLEGGKIGVKLVEIGPRMELQLVKGEAGMMGGTVLFHRYQTKTPTEVEVLERRAKNRKMLKSRNERLERKIDEKKMSVNQKRKAKEARNKKTEDGDSDDGKAPKGQKRMAEKQGNAFERNPKKAKGQDRGRTVEINSSSKGKGKGKSKGKGKGKGDEKGKGKGKGKGRKGSRKGGGKSRKGGGK